jgi:hypothetical protein
MTIITMRITVDLDYPLIVISSFAVIPAMTVMVVRIARSVVMVLTASGRKRQDKSGPQQKCGYVSRSTLHEGPSSQREMLALLVAELQFRVARVIGVIPDDY